MTFLRKYGIWIALGVLFIVQPELLPVELAAGLIVLAVKKFG